MRARVLEIASGTGEHALYFASRLEGVSWQPSDPDSSFRDSIAEWTPSSGLANLLPPLDIDVRRADWGVGPVDAIVCINMIHIAPWESAEGLFEGARRSLREGGVLYLYGPYAMSGRHTAPSNEAFDRSLRSRNPDWGVRDLDDVVALAHHSGFVHRETVEMPANNFSLVFARVVEP